MQVERGCLLEKKLVLRDPIAQATVKENDGMIYNESRVRDYVVPGYARRCKVTLESCYDGLSFDAESCMLTWSTDKVEKGKYVLHFTIEDECMKDVQEVQVEII